MNTHHLNQEDYPTNTYNDNPPVGTLKRPMEDEIPIPPLPEEPKRLEPVDEKGNLVPPFCQTCNMGELVYEGEGFWICNGYQEDQTSCPAFHVNGQKPTFPFSHIPHQTN